MGRRRAIICGQARVRAAMCLIVALAAACPASAQSQELPPDLVQALSTIEDFTYDFDHPAYYQLLEFVQNSPRPPGSAVESVAVNDWRSLVERPADFRGLPITIEGVIGRNKDPYTHPLHPQLRPVAQVELSRPDQPVTCTIIFARDVADLPVGATIRVAGYFVKINRFPRTSGEPGLSALVVASGPSQVSHAAVRPAQSGPDWRWMVLAVICGLFFTLLLIRRAGRFRRHDLRNIEIDAGPRTSLAADLADWAQRDPPDGEPPPPAAGAAK